MKTLFTQVFCIRNGQVLLMHRRKQPNLDLWVAPGGKIEVSEAPFEGAIRELKEETGFIADSVKLQGFVTIEMPRLQANMMHFLFLVTEFTGELVSDEREGVLMWHELGAAYKLDMPAANVKFLPHVLEPSKDFYQAKYTYDANWNLLQVTEHGLNASAV